MRPTWRVGGAVLFCLVLEWYGATSEVPWLFLLGAWIVALIAATAVYAAWNRSGLRLHLAVRSTHPGPGSPAEELPDNVLRTAPQGAPLFEGDQAELEVGLDTKRASRGPAWVSGRLADRRVDLATGLVPRSGWRRSQVAGELRRGVLGATGWAVGTSDPLGFFAGRRECPDVEVGLVLPRFTSLAQRRETRELETATAAPRAGSGNELFGVREYRPGDSLRRIHWRSSARHAELVVREYEPPGVQTLGILVDPVPPTREVADQIARIAASEAWDCLRDGGRVVIWGPGLEPSDSPRDLWGLLEWLARYPELQSGMGPVVGLPTVAVTANPELLETSLVRAWMVGDAEVDTDVSFQRVGIRWPL